MITQQRLKELFKYLPETGEFIRLIDIANQKAGSVAGYERDGYLVIGIDSTKEYAHRLAFLYMEGYMPEEVDHKDRDGLNNRWDNLRKSTSKQNKQNRKIPNKSGYSGISWSKQRQKWYVRIQGVCGGVFNYEDLSLAIKKANNLRVQKQGDFARLEEFQGTIPSLEELNK